MLPSHTSASSRYARAQDILQASRAIVFAAGLTKGTCPRHGGRKSDARNLVNPSEFQRLHRAHVFQQSCIYGLYCPYLAAARFRVVSGSVAASRLLGPTNLRFPQIVSLIAR